LNQSLLQSERLPREPSGRRNSAQNANRISTRASKVHDSETNKAQPSRIDPPSVAKASDRRQSHSSSRKHRSDSRTHTGTAVLTTGTSRSTTSSRRIHPIDSKASERHPTLKGKGSRMSSNLGEESDLTDSNNHTPNGRRPSNGNKLHQPLHVATSAESNGDLHKAKSSHEPQTPATLPPTPDKDLPDTPTGLRGSTDLRSPGHSQTPTILSAANGRQLKVAAEGGPIPDLITQTDRNGLASTPRNADSINEASRFHPTGAKPHLHIGKDGKLHEDEDQGDGDAQASKVSDVDACAETFYDSLRLVCCCLVPEDVIPASSNNKGKIQTPEIEDDFGDSVDENHDNQNANGELVESRRPQLLPSIHADDRGKKCLVLDLDETLVHSSFRAGTCRFDAQKVQKSCQRSVFSGSCFCFTLL
jgi:hypothetical protein